MTKYKERIERTVSMMIVDGVVNPAFADIVKKIFEQVPLDDLDFKLRVQHDSDQDVVVSLVRGDVVLSIIITLTDATFIIQTGTRIDYVGADSPHGKFPAALQEGLKILFPKTGE